jgi:voltage-gated potassium channel
MDPSTLNDHIVLLGWDSFGDLVSRTLLAAGKAVVVVSSDPSVVEGINGRAASGELLALRADYRNQADLRRAGLDRAAVVFINLPTDREKLVCSFHIRKEWPSVRIVAPVNNPNLRETFVSACDVHPISNDEIAAKIFSSYLFERDVAEYLSGLLSPAEADEDHDIQQYRVAAGSPLCGQSYGDVFASLKRDYNAVLMGLSKPRGDARALLKNPPDATPIEADDYVILLLSGAAAQRVEAHLGVGEGF